ncbi:hypothetical protein J0H58_21615 [bacterium]|nr:hypothetical protein [bacterium]
MAGESFAKTGIDGVVLRNTGTYGSPTLVEITLVRDVNFGLPWDFGDASSRATPIKLYEAVQGDLAISVVVRADDVDAGFQALFDAAMQKGAKLDLLVLDGPVTEEGAAGVRAHFKPSLTGQAQAIGDVQYCTFDLKAGYHTDGVPKIVDVGAESALTYTSF